jgi:hypothetical protein
MQQRGKYTSITREEKLGNGVFCWGDPRLYNEGEKPARIRIESVSGDGSQMIEKRRQEIY